MSAHLGSTAPPGADQFVKVVGKYAIPSESPFVLDLPKGAKILSLSTIREEPFLWAFVRPEAEKERRTFFVVPTGDGLVTSEQDCLDYIGTFQLSKRGELYMFHVFEQIDGTRTTEVRALRTLGLKCMRCGKVNPPLNSDCPLAVGVDDGQIGKHDLEQVIL